MTKRTAMIAAVLAMISILAVPVSSAHGAVNARELEVLVLKDELSDFQTSLAGYDLGEFYVAEAWIAGLGDGLYFHTIFFGSFPGNPPAREYEVRFTLDDGRGTPITRSIQTSDGSDFRTDFDLLEAEAEDGQVEVERAFLRFEGTSLTRGSLIKTFVVESFADGQLRDRAPGGIYAPGPGNPEVPAQGSSNQVVPSFALEGPIKYAAAQFRETEASNEYIANITSRLTKGAQHVHLETPEWALDDPAASGWSFELLGSPGGEVPGNGSTEVRFRLEPIPDADGLVMAQRLNVTTDVGGRLAFQIRAAPNGGVVFVPEQNATGWAPSEMNVPKAESPGAQAPFVLLALTAGLVMALRRRN